MLIKLQKEEKKHCNDDIRIRKVATFIQSCWRRLLARKELQRLQNEAKELSIQLVGDSRTNHLEERGNDTIQARSNSDFDVKRATIQVYGNSCYSQSDRWIGLILHGVSRHIVLHWVKISGQSEFGKALQYGSTKAVRILLFTSF